MDGETIPIKADRDTPAVSLTMRSMGTAGITSFLGLSMRGIGAVV